MARGWESKSVELQMEDADEAKRGLPDATPFTEAQIRTKHEMEALQVTRVRVVRDLDATMNPRMQVQLRAALQHLDEKLVALRHTT